MDNVTQSVTRHSNLHKCLAILLSVLMMFSLMPMTVFAEDTIIANGQCGNTAYWKIVDNGTDKTFIVYGSGDMWIRTAWTGDDFDAYDITKIVIEEGITSIGAVAFGKEESFAYGSGLPSTSSFGGYAQNSSGNCEYKIFKNATGSLVIPDSVTSIGKEAFYGCSGFNGTLTLGNNLQTIGVSAFSNCNKLTGNLVIPDSVTAIGHYAFRNCSGFNGTLTLGNSVQTIGNAAFYNCDKLTGNLVIPDSVTAIGNSAFYSCRGFNGSLTIGNNVQTIGSQAFVNCYNLTGVLVIPDSVITISSSAFTYCSGFTGSLVIPDSVISIGLNAFNGCSGFDGTLTLGNSVLTIGANAFEECSGFTGPLVIPDSVITIEPATFYGCSGFDGTLTLGNSVRTICEEAFENCSGFTGSLVVPDSVITIDTSAFEGCSGFDGTLTLGNSVQTIGTYAFNNCSGFTGSLVIPDSVTSIGQSAFRSCRGFDGTLTLGNSVQTISNWAFYGCNKLTGTLEIPNSVESIGECAFHGTASYTNGSDTYNGNLEDCNPYKFFEYYRGDSPDDTYQFIGVVEGSRTEPTPTQNGTQVYYIYCVDDFHEGELHSESLVATINEPIEYVPTSVDVIANGQCGDTAYWKIVDDGTDKTFVVYGSGDMWMRSHWTGDSFDAYDITKIVIEEGITSIGQQAFGSISSGNVSWEGETSSCGGYEGHYIKNFKNVTGQIVIPNSVTRIRDNAFSNCNISSVVFGNSLQAIGKQAFSFCAGLTGTLTLPNGLTSIGSSAFARCSGLTGMLVFPNGLTTIGDNAFNGCYGFTGSLVIPDSVTSIGSSAFSSCAGFNGTLTLSSSLTSIPTYCFYKCTGFNGDIVIPNSVTSIGSQAFYQDTGFNGSITLSSNLISIGKEAFYYCTKLTGSLVIPNSVRTIAESAFYNCYKLNGTLTLGTSLQTIGVRAFYACSGFTGSLVIPDSVTSIGIMAFQSCTGFNGTLTLSNNLQRIENNTFSTCWNFTGSLVIPDSVTSIGEEAFDNCPRFDGLLTIGNNVQTIGARAFALCERLNGTLVIPDSVTSIGQDAFHGTASRTNGVNTYNGNLEDCNTYKFFEHYRGDSPDDDYQFIEIVEGDRTEPTPTQNGTQVYHIYCNDASHDGAQTLSTLMATVNEPIEYVPVSSIEYLGESPLLLAVGDTKLLDINTTPDNATSAVLTFNSADNSIATVDENGNVTAVSAGPAIITVSAENGTVTKDVPILVVDAVPSANTTLVPGEQTVISATLLPENCEAFISRIEPTCDTNDVIELNDTNVTAVAIGTETVTVEIGIKYNYDEDNAETVFVTKELVFNVVNPHTHTPGEPVHENDVRDDNAGTYTFELNRYCTEDGDYVDGETVVLTLVPAVAAVPGTDGNVEYFTDGEGNKYIWDAVAEKYEPTDDVTTHVHNPGESRHENDVRDDDAGTYTFELNRYCTEDGEFVDGETVVLTIVPAVEAVPGTNGNVEYFVDDKDNDDPTDDDIYVWDDETDRYYPTDNIVTHVHNPGEPVHENDVRDDDAGTYTFELNTYCQEDGAPVGSETVVLEIVPLVEAIPGRDGHNEYFVDDKGNDDPTDDDIYAWDADEGKYVPGEIIPTHVHNPGEPRHENDVRDDNAGTYTFELNTYCESEDPEVLLNSELVVLDIVPAVDAVPGTNGNIEYFVDDKGNDDPTDDDIYIWDDDADKYVPFDGDVTIHIHNPGTPAQENANPDTTNPGFDMVTRCEEDGEILNSEHVDLTYVPERAPDDTADGYEAYYIDDNSNVYDYDEDNELFVPSEVHYIHNPGELVHENDKHNDATGEYSFDLATYCTNDGTELDRETIVLTKHDAKDPSQDSDGNIEYYEDEDGNKYLWDEDEGKYVPTDDTSIIVPRTPVTSLIATADRTDLDIDGIRSAQITAEILPENASDKRVTYVSSNPNVVMVDSNGRVTAVGGGTATVTVSSKSNPEVKDTIAFNVVQDTYRLDGPNSSNIGETGTISMYTDTAKPYYVKYFTSNDSLLEIDEDTGAYTVRGAGNVTITARVYFGDGTTKDVTKSFRCFDPDAGKFRCKMCDTYEAMKDAPVVGIFYTIVHFFVHFAHSIGFAT